MNVPVLLYINSAAWTVTLIFTWHGGLHYIHSDLQPLLCCEHSVVPLVGQVEAPGQGWTDLDADSKAVIK